MSFLDFHIGDACERNIDGTWYRAEITKIFKTFASVKYLDDDKTENEIPLDHENLKRPYAVVSPATSIEDSNSNSNETGPEGFFVEVGILSTSTSPVSMSEDETEADRYSYTGDQLVHDLGSSMINLGNAQLRPFKYEFDNIQSVPYSDLAQYDKKDFIHTHLPNGDIRLKLLFIPSCGDLHSARSVTKYLEMEYYWRDPSRTTNERDRFLVPNLKPLAGLCASCERWTIFGCSKCFSAFYCNRKCQQEMWSHHKVYCGDTDFNTNNNVNSSEMQFSRCNEYLRSVGYVPAQRVLSGTRKQKVASTTCGTSMREATAGASSSGDSLASASSSYRNNSAMVHPFDENSDIGDITGGGERRVYTSPTTAGATRKVYDIRDHNRPTNNSRAPPHHGLHVATSSTTTSKNDWETGDLMNQEQDSKSTGQWDWQPGSQFIGNDLEPVPADAYLLGPIDEFESAPLQRVGSNNSLYCARSVGRASPIPEEDGQGDAFDDDLSPYGGDVSLHDYFPMGSDYSAFTQNETIVSGTVTPPAHHGYNTRSSSTLSQRGHHSLDRQDVNNMLLRPDKLSALLDLDIHEGCDIERGGMGRRGAGCMSPTTTTTNNNPMHRRTRFQEQGYVSDSEVPALIPTDSSGRVTEIDPAFEESVKNLVDGMGLNEALVREALVMFPSDLDQAVNYVLNQTQW